ncbi:MAG: TonB-dependent receptor [Bacteroidales bacterium]|nr:TonB-dependent receptor [Bacteroidales bacterium]
MKKIIVILVLVNLFMSAYSSDDLIISGRFENTPFKKFVQEIEDHYHIQFFYRKEWITEITITASGDSLSLKNLLDENLSGKGLHYTFQYNKVFITQKAPLVTSLPEFKLLEENNDSLKEINGENGITEAEKLYLEGRKSGSVKILNIGNKNLKNPNKPAVIKGKIQDIETGEPLIGATVYFEELGKGAASDINGHFIISIFPGKYNVKFSSLGMEEVSYLVDVYSSGQLDIDLKKKLIAIDEVTIKANRYDNLRGIQMGLEQLSIRSIKEIPVVMGERDILKVAQMLPGVQTVGEGSAGFNVRGSAADQNMFYINKVPVYNTSHLFGFFTSFSPDIVKSFSLYKSNIPAKYGGRLASIFDIISRQGNKKKFTARGGISPVTGHVAVEGPIKKDKSSFVISARSTYSDWLLSRINNPEIRNSDAFFYDLAANVNIEPDNKNLYKIFSYYSSDQFSFASTHKYKYSNQGASISWRHQYSSKMYSDFAAIYGSYYFKTSDHSTEQSAFTHAYQIDHYEIKSDITWVPMQNHMFTYGGNLIYYGLNRGEILPDGDESIRIPVYLGHENGIEGAFYLSDEYQVTSWLTLYGGIRYSYYGYLGPSTVYQYDNNAPIIAENIIDSIDFNRGEIVKFYSGPELRGALNLRTGQLSSVKLSYNRTRQYLFMLSNTIAISPTDQWKLVDYHIRPPVADQVALGFYKDLAGRNVSISAEIYYKSMNNIVEYKDGAEFLSAPNIETELLQGEQTAYGLELMAKKNEGRLSGWLSFSYSHSNILINGQFPWEKINEGISYPSNYDRPLAVNTVINYKINRRISLSSNLVYNTGRPVTYPITTYLYDGIENILYSSRNQYRIPDYFRMDISINLEGNLKARKVAHSYWMLNIYNLTGRKNAYSVYFQNEDGEMKGYKMSIFGRPIVTLSWNFKLGNYESE